VIEFPEVEPGADVIVSATLFMTYSRCPDQALGRLHGFYPEESRASFKGGLAHRVFARHLSTGPIGSGQLEQACREEIGAGLNPALGSLGLRPSELTAVIREVGDLYQRFKVLSSEGFRESEVFLEEQPTAGVTLRGSVDALFDNESGVRLVDWKTGGLYETDEQLSFYALLWALVHGELPTCVEAISIGSGESVVVRPTEDSVQATATLVAGMVSELRGALDVGDSELEKTAGPWCRYCALLSTCREGVAAVKLADS
jgi:hypothetical protein